jgi:protoporphyrinogen oxidase
MFSENLILGGGLAGLSLSFHLGHERCLVLEAKPHLFGLLASRQRNGFTWDNGPHNSFTKHQYVRDLFAASAEDEINEIPAVVGNWFHGSWVRHPAQNNLFHVPEPLRSRCVRDFLALRENVTAGVAPQNYREWLDASLGETFAENFSAAYTRKFWTLDAKSLGTEWVGGRVHRPQTEDVLAGAKADLNKNFHYIQSFRYPKQGGYQTFAKTLAMGVRAKLNTQVVSIDLEKKQLATADGSVHSYKRLFSTIPLPEFIAICVQSTAAMKRAAAKLLCTSAVLVEVELPAQCERPEHWFYVYDEDMLSTRINFTEKLSVTNAPEGASGVQVEVYFSKEKPLVYSDVEIAGRVLHELEKMKLFPDAADPRIRVHTTRLSFANVAFPLDTPENLDIIFAGLVPFGLCREPNDTHPTTDWAAPASTLGELVFAGRFGQWKYFWSDDCVLRGRTAAQKIRPRP